MVDPGTRVAKHSVVVAGHRTSVTVEDAFWDELTRIAAAEGLSLNQLITRIDANRADSLSSALRVFVLERLKPSA